MAKDHYAFSMKTLQFVNVSLNELVGVGEHGKRVKERVIEDETIVAITDPSRKSLAKLFRAYQLNPLILFDMSITQYVSKIVPYPAQNYNKEKAFNSEDEYIGEVSLSEDSDGEDFKGTKKNRIHDAILYNLVYRDDTDIEK